MCLKLIRERISLDILIVDDSKLNLNIAQDMLIENHIQCSIVLANSGEEAISILDKMHIDIVLLDIVMPGLSGVEVLKIIKSSDKYKNTNVIMLTSLRDKSILKQCFELGASDFINKPIDSTEFIARIKASIREIFYKESLEGTFEMVSSKNKKLSEANKTLRETQFYITQKEKIVAVGELAAGIAHELNTPLGYVSSNFEVFKKDIEKVKDIITMYHDLISQMNALGIENGDIKNAVDKIKNEEKSVHLDFVLEDLDGLIDESKDGVDKAAEIVRALRNFAEIEFEPNIKLNDLNSIIEEVLLITSSEYKGKITVEKNFKDIPMVSCSRGMISQVLINIITNAFQFVKISYLEEGGKVTIETFNDDKYVICRVVDNGPGIRPEIMNRIFNPFFTTKDVGEGTGLGLSVAYDIVVNKHNGQLVVENNKPSGAIFTVKLPFDYD